MLFCYRYLGNYQKADIMWSAYCKKTASNIWWAAFANLLASSIAFVNLLLAEFPFIKSSTGIRLLVYLAFYCLHLIV